MAVSGYDIGAAAVAAAARGDLTQALQNIAHSTGIANPAGFPERGADGRVCNAAHLTDSTGQGLATCRKTHVYGPVDRSRFGAGQAPFQPVTSMGWKLGTCI